MKRIMRYVPLANALARNIYLLCRKSQSIMRKLNMNQYIGGREKKEITENIHVPRRLPKILIV